jgi:hypothetical protein
VAVRLGADAEGRTIATGVIVEVDGELKAKAFRSLREEAAAMHPSVFAAEYECRFTTMGADNWFDIEMVRACVDQRLEAWI